MLLEARDIRVSFRKENQKRLFGRERATILHGVSLELEKGECLGIIGESGSGKSTLGRVLCGLLRPDSGKVLLNGTPLYGRHTPEELARIRNRISIVFQDYTTSVNPRFRVSTILHESFRALRRAGREAVPLLYGVTAMLVIAAIFEAFWSSNAALGVPLRLAVGAGLWVLVGLWLGFAGRRHAG